MDKEGRGRLGGKRGWRDGDGEMGEKQEVEYKWYREWRMMYVCCAILSNADANTDAEMQCTVLTESMTTTQTHNDRATASRICRPEGG